MSPAIKQTEALLQPFLAHSAPIRSIVAFGSRELLDTFGTDFPIAQPAPALREAVLIRLAAEENENSAIVVRCEGERPLESLAQQVRSLSATSSGSDLLVVAADLLQELMPPPGEDFGFRAVAALFSDIHDPAQPEDWKLRRRLFDRGLICVGSVPIAGRKALCFLASDAVRASNQLHIEPRGLVSMPVLKEGAAFANQLFRYACVKLYALRHGLTPAFPAWEGNQLFGLNDKSCEGLKLPELSYLGFAQNDREIWERDEPPINFSLAGYFQEIPECWRRHRALLRRLFQLAPEHLEAIEAWRDDVTDGGKRTLVAVHIRRGDYRRLDHMPYFRLVPVNWYIAWLRSIWPALANPVLFVATNEPDAILPKFREFERVSATFGLPAANLSDYVREFEAMRQSDYLAICNSSFGRMAAILAPSTQKCFLPSFSSESFAPYEPWIDPAFWVRFAGSELAADLSRPVKERPASPLSKKPLSEKNVRGASSQLPSIFVDVSDLLAYLLSHPDFTGMPRAQCEILRNLVEIGEEQRVRTVVLNQRRELGEIETSILLSAVADIRAGTIPRAAIEAKLRSMAARMSPCSVSPGEIFLTLGAFWKTRGMGALLQQIKNSGAIIGIWIHDILPVTAPEYFDAHDARVFAKGLNEALTFAGFVLTTTEYCKASLAKHLAAVKLGPLPIHTIPLGRGLSLSTPIETRISPQVAGILESEYVLCAGSIDARKNPPYLFNIWKMMLSSGRSNVPHLVFLGRKGWSVQDFLEQLKACDHLGGRITVLHSVTDFELNTLYRECLLTMFPSFLEGSALPVSESLACGKICLCSGHGAIPEVGGKLADYIDPYNARDGFEKLTRYLDDAELRRKREREISEGLPPRSWGDVAEDLLRSVDEMTAQTPPAREIAAIALPRDRYLAISSEAAGMPGDGADGALSAELICISGWHPAETSGVRAAQSVATIRFRVDAPIAARVNVVMRFAAFGRDFSIRISPGSGDETHVSIPSGSERLIVVACEVEPGKLITAQMSSLGAILDGDEFPGASYWMLKGILCFDPKHITASTLKHLKSTAGSSHAPQPSGTGARPAAAAPTVDPSDRPGDSRRDRTLLRPTAMDESRRAGSLQEFLQTADSYWFSAETTACDAPIFADHADCLAFYSALAERNPAPRVGRLDDSIKLVRRSNAFVSTARFSEGSVFDGLGVWKGFANLQSLPPGCAPWLSNEIEGISVSGESLRAAPYHEGSHLIFYDGNLHHYDHWLAEGLLCLDILTQALGTDRNLRIALPASTQAVAPFDHLESLRAVDLGGDCVVPVAADLIKVQEAIWVDCDLSPTMPAVYLKNFQRRVAGLYQDLRTPPGRRLLLAGHGPGARICNIQQVQNLLSRYSFETFDLEEMSLRDQILLFQSAEFVVSPHGAGLANLLFCEPGTKVVELTPSGEMRPRFWLIAEKLELVYALQYCRNVPGRGITVDVEKLQALIGMVNAHL
jgi:glycosyltransferase involved in cell wall biosynthesis